MIVLWQSSNSNYFYEHTNCFILCFCTLTLNLVENSGTLYSCFSIDLSRLRLRYLLLLHIDLFKLYGSLMLPFREGLQTIFIYELPSILVSIEMLRSMLSYLPCFCMRRILPLRSICGCKKFLLIDFFSIFSTFGILATDRAVLFELNCYFDFDMLLSKLFFSES